MCSTFVLNCFFYRGCLFSCCIDTIMTIVKYFKQINQHKFYQSLNIRSTPVQIALQKIDSIKKEKSFFFTRTCILPTGLISCTGFGFAGWRKCQQRFLGKYHTVNSSARRRIKTDGRLFLR